MPESYGALMRHLRKRMGLTMGDVARHAEVSVPYISEVENGRRRALSVEKTKHIATILGDDAEQLLLEARAQEMGRYEYKYDVRPEAQRFGAALMRRWPPDDGTLQKLFVALEGAGEEN